MSSGQLNGDHRKPQGRKMKFVLALITISIFIFLVGSAPVLALHRSLVVNRLGQHFGDKNIHGVARKSRFPEDRDGRADSRPGHKNSQAQGGDARMRDLKFAHLTTNDGLSQGYVTAILQDRRGFMWFATRDGLNRYDGNSFVVYKHDPNDPGSLSSNFLQDLLEDEHGYLWISTNTG